MSLKSLPARRIEWIDVARGLGIVLVVYGHVLRGLNSAGLIAQSNPFWASDYAIYTFHMPLFFLLAGLNVERSMRKGQRAFLTNKLWTLAYPYLLWSLLQGSIQLLLPGYLNAPRVPLALVYILWRPIAQFWFLYALFFCHITAWAANARRFPLAIIALFALFFGHYLPGPIAALIAYVFPFYVAGILLSSVLFASSPNLKDSLLWTGVSAALFAECLLFGRDVSGGNSAALASFPAALAGISLTIGISHMIVRVSKPFKRFMGFLGAASLTIYILHVLVASASRAGLKRIHLGWESQLLLETILATLIPAALHVILRRLGLLPILGLAAPDRSRRKATLTPATELGV